MSDRDAEARLLIQTLRDGLAKGHQYFHPITDEPLLTVSAIIKCMVDETSVLIRTPPDVPEPPVDIDFRPAGGFKVVSLMVRNEVTSGTVQ
jgi:hypothetical protein